MKTLLAFDIGNSRTKIGLFENKKLAALVSFDTRSPGYAKVSADAMKMLLYHNEQTPADITGIVIASVVPVRTKTIATVTQGIFKKRALMVSSRSNTGLTIQYQHPEKLGNDRLCVAVAAYHKFGGPVIVIDWGTATKFDIVDAKGNYLGGAIAPGLESSARMLMERTAQLPGVKLELPPSVIGNNTVNALQSGILYGIIELTKGMVSRIKKEFGTKPRVIATGGFAQLLAQHLHGIDSVEPYLVLDGARIVYERSVRKKK